jgi:lipopolysaccharide/colanic/teichoic acid biosynthesis glycosyltransferase
MARVFSVGSPLMSRLARLLVLVTIPAVVLGLSKVHAAYWAAEAYDFTGSFRLVWAAAFVGLLWLSSYAVGLPALVRGPRESLVAATASVGLSVFSISVIQLLTGDALLPRFVVFGSALLLVPILTVLGILGARGRQHRAERDRVLFVGGRTEAEQLRDDLHSDVEQPATLLTAVEVADVDPTVSVGLAQRVRDIDANLLVLDVSAQADEVVVSQAATVHETGVRVRTLSLFYEEWLGKLPVTELERVSLLFDVGELHRARYARMKRIFDGLAGAAGCVVLAVVVPFVALGNVVANRGPLFFSQTRVGKGGEEFTILKFRTMRPGSSDGTWTGESDARITPFGKVLRRSHLDELPQVVNIVKGDLSLVGPRPEQPRYVHELSEKLPFYGIRHLVRPGLTGWAQVKYGYAADERDALQKLQYEFFYLRRQSFLFDARIIVRTLRHLGSGGGR